MGVSRVNVGQSYNLGEVYMGRKIERKREGHEQLMLHV